MSHRISSPSFPSSFGGPIRSAGLGSRTVGLSIPTTGSTGIEFAVRESAAQIKDLKKKLKMVSNVLLELQKSLRYDFVGA